ncbi:MAG: hypothetical protein ACK5JO_03905 [Halodesulfovibrio sp.]
MKNLFLIEFAYPCVAYVIKRLGLSVDIERILAMRGERYSSTTPLMDGDIVVWERSDGPHVSDATLTFSQRGPITTRLHLGRHFGVYEGEGLVSDLTFDGDTYYPRIRLMLLADHPFPKEVIRKEAIEG